MSASLAPAGDPGSSGAPAISVAMATYNGFPYLKEQLESIREQSLPPSEIVICDDGSIDQTWDYLSAVSAADSRIRVYRNAARLGSTKNFERAIGFCTGEIIFLSDQDDAWLPTKIADLTATLLANDSVLAMSNGRLVKEDGTELGLSLWEANEIDSHIAQVLQSKSAFELLSRNCYFTGSAFCFRALLKDFALPIPAGIWHDQWIALIASLVAPGRLALTDRNLYRYRQHSRNQIGARLQPLLTWKRPGAWARLWREIRSHEDIVLDAKHRGLAIERLNWMAGHKPNLLTMTDVQSAVELLTRRRDHALARSAYIERRRPLWDPLTARRLRDYFEFSRGLRTVARDLLSRLFYRRRRREPATAGPSSD